MCRNFSGKKCIEVFEEKTVKTLREKFVKFQKTICRNFMKKHIHRSFEEINLQTFQSRKFVEISGEKVYRKLQKF